MKRRELLQRAKARLDRLELYPEPVDLRGVRIVIAPWLFRVPGFRRFRGYATRHLILLKHPVPDEDLVVHELCHVWQLQFRPLRVWLSYARPSTFSRDRSRYRANRYEVEARRAVELTRLALEAELVPQPTGKLPEQVLLIDPKLIQQALVTLWIDPIGQLAVRPGGLVVVAALTQQIENRVLRYLHPPPLSGTTPSNLEGSGCAEH